MTKNSMIVSIYCHVSSHQVATGFLIEVGNGDKFIFDLGSGAFLNLFATGVPPSKLDKVTLVTYIRIPLYRRQEEALHTHSIA